MSAGQIRADALPRPPERWELPERGPVGMICLIIAEAAIFLIFVVAYLFYLGKSATGPQPKDVLDLPVFLTICLLSSSATIGLAVAALRRGRDGLFRVRISLDEPPLHEQMTLCSAVITGEARSLLHGVFDNALSVLVRESGF